MDNVDVKCANKKDSLDNGILDEALGGPEACALAAEIERNLSIKTTKVVNGLVNGLSERKCSDNRISKKGSVTITKSIDGSEHDLNSNKKSATSANVVQDKLLLTACSNKTNECNVENTVSVKILDRETLEASTNDTEDNKTTPERDTKSSGVSVTPIDDIDYVQYESELQMPMIMKIIQKDLSEPYSIYTYRYFIHNWPKLCFLAMCGGKCVGAIVCKLDLHRKTTRRGYIAMLAVDKDYRKRSIGSTLVRRAIEEMVAGDADEVVLETEVTNKPALRLYEALGFVRDKRLFRYYMNGVDALRLKLWLR